MIKGSWMTMTATTAIIPGTLLRHNRYREMVGAIATIIVRNTRTEKILVKQAMAEKITNFRHPSHDGLRIWSTHQKSALLCRNIKSA